MKIQYEDESFDFDMEQITVRQAMYIHTKLGLTLLGLDQGLGVGNPDALLAVYWLMRTQAEGKLVDIDTLDFKVVKLANAVQDAIEAEQKEEADAEEAAGPKGARARG